MGMMDSIASSYMSMSAASLAQNYALAVTKMQMDTTEELALQELQEMLPEAPSPYSFDIRV